MKIYPGLIIAFTGLPGAGKTGYMSLLASMASAAGWRVVSNYTLACAAARVRSFDDLQQRSTLICLDEFQLIAGSRNFTSKLNKSISEWIELDIRKPQNALFYTAQDFNMVDVNARRLTSYIFDCTLVPGRGYTIVQVIQNLRFDQYVLRGKSLLPHSRFIGLYDTYDRDVRLVS